MIKSKIYVAGHTGMVGSAIIRCLKNHGFINIITTKHEELDLTNQTKVFNFFKKEKPNEVYIAAAKVGGIFANNTYPANFIYENLMIACNIIHASFLNDVKKILFLGSSCIYPKFAKQPIEEKSLLTGLLEPTNEPYAISKIAGIKICESYNRQYGNSHGVDYRSVIPSNLYGIEDNFHHQNSHVIPALIRRFHEAKMNKDPNIYIWGSGSPMREFLYVDDLAEACLCVMNLDKKVYQQHTRSMLSHINIGSAKEITIKELSEVIKEIVDYKGQIKFDVKKPDGSPRKLLDSKLINRLGWAPKVDLREGLIKVYELYKKKND